MSRDLTRVRVNARKPRALKGIRLEIAQGIASIASYHLSMTDAPMRITWTSGCGEKVTYETGGKR